LLSQVGEILLLNVPLLLHSLLYKSSCTLVCELCVLIITTAVAVVRSLSWGIVSNWWLVSSLCLHGHVGEIEPVLRSGHRRHVIVDLYVGRHRRRLTNRLRSRIPWKVSNLESRQPFLPALDSVSICSAWLCNEA
jgi:hypothetical protein